MLDFRRLPAGQGPSKNAYFRRQGNGPNPTSFTVIKKTKASTPSNWPIMLARTVNAQLRLRQLPELMPMIDVESHMPSSLLLTGRHQSFDADRSAVHRTHGALLVGVNYYDRWLQHSLGSSRKLEVESTSRQGVLRLRTNLSMARSVHSLCPPLLSDIRGVIPAHFSIYVSRRHLLGIRVDCRLNEELDCRCRELAESLLPAMWVTQ